MPAPFQLPSVYSDKGYQQSSRNYAKQKMTDLSVAGIEDALAKAYLDGAQSAIRVGYLIAEKEISKLKNV